MEYISPPESPPNEAQESDCRFTCPHCDESGCYTWKHIYYTSPDDSYAQNQDPDSIVTAAYCKLKLCEKPTIWISEKNNHSIIYPNMIGPSPNGDLSEEVKKYYNEARKTLPVSKRGAAGLMRAALEQLTREENCKGDNLHAKIQHLYNQKKQAGMSEDMRKVLVHINDKGNSIHVNRPEETEAEIKKALHMINMIAEDLYTRPKQFATFANERKKPSKDQTDSSPQEKQPTRVITNPPPAPKDDSDDLPF